MDNKSITALMSCFVRAYIAESPERVIFNDFMAKKLICKDEYFAVKSHIIAGKSFFLPEIKEMTDEEVLSKIIKTQLAPTPIARSRFCEDSLKTAILTGTEQYVILGAGLDTYAYRNSIGTTVFEVDHPKTQEDKIKRLLDANIQIPIGTKFVSVDFSKDEFKERLLDAGFDIDKKTFFSLLGVSYYLSQDGFERVLQEISSFAADGSTLLFDFADAKLFSAKEKRVQNMLAMAQAAGEPMQFCIDEAELEVLLDKHSFLIYELMSSDDIQRKYFENTTKEMSAFEHISFCTSVLKNNKTKSTKETILQEALRLFATYGYDAVSVRDIAGKIGITQAAIYKHYKNKRDIFDNIIKRMEINDFERAKAYGMPDGEIGEVADNLKSIPLENIVTYSIAQFRYWTENIFASSFRKVLTLEQYKNKEMSRLYSQYLTSGPMTYMSEVFEKITNNRQRAELLALDFYGPFYFLITLYDDFTDKMLLHSLLTKHINEFVSRLKKN